MWNIEVLSMSTPELQKKKAARTAAWSKAQADADKKEATEAAANLKAFAARAKSYEAEYIKVGEAKAVIARCLYEAITRNLLSKLPLTSLTCLFLPLPPSPKTPLRHRSPRTLLTTAERLRPVVASLYLLRRSSSLLSAFVVS